jgi:thymidylate synthase ThyX
MTTSAKVIAHTRSTLGVEIFTLEVVFPRFILAELNTHRALAKSSASSRAIPMIKRIAEVKNNSFVPETFTKNQKGMSARENLDDTEAADARAAWLAATTDAVFHAAKMAAAGTHKQHAARILEPFLYHKAVITGTEWVNFYKLRLSSEAQPEFQKLAELMHAAMCNSVPNNFITTMRGRVVHLPYVEREDVDGRTVVSKLHLDELINISAARCARVSYNSLLSNKRSSVAEDAALAYTLIDSGHMSPFDHPAVEDVLRRDWTIGRNFGRKNRWSAPEVHRHLYGWIPARVSMEQDIVPPRNSHLPFREEYAEPEMLRLLSQMRD